MQILKIILDFKNQKERNNVKQVDRNKNIHPAQNHFEMFQTWIMKIKIGIDNSVHQKLRQLKAKTRETYRNTQPIIGTASYDGQLTHCHPYDHTIAVFVSPSKWKIRILLNLQLQINVAIMSVS